VYCGGDKVVGMTGSFYKACGNGGSGHTTQRECLMDLLGQQEYSRIFSTQKPACAA
jgi:7-keto-8-aminopelargonate synthetase-like enzyme